MLEQAENHEVPPDFLPHDGDEEFESTTEIR